VSRALQPDHRRFLIVDQGIGPTIINFLLNALIAWLSVRTLATVALWGQPGIAPDTIATTFLLPFITCLIVGKIVDHQVGNGRVRALARGELPEGSLAFRASYQHGLLLGAACVLLVGLPAVWALGSLDVAELSRDRFIAFKAIFAAVLGALVTPLIGWWALMRASNKRPS
jgi:hypothetical protein